MIACYNEQEGEPLTWQAAIDLHIPGQENSDPGSVSCEIKRQAVGHLRLVKRSREEICRLKDEMANCLTFYHDKIQQLEVIQQQLTNGFPLNRFHQGSLNLVKRQLCCDHKRLLELQRAFSRRITIENHVLSADRPTQYSVPLSPPSPSIHSHSDSPSPSTQNPSLRESPKSLISLGSLMKGKSLAMSEISPSATCTSLSMDIPYSPQLKACHARCSTLSKVAGHQSEDILPSIISNHSSLLSSSTAAVSSPSPTKSTQLPSERLLNFVSPSSPFMPRWFLSETRNEQKKRGTLYRVNGNPNTPHSSENDTVSDDLSESLVTPFEDESTECLVSVRVPETNIQSHSGCSDDEGSSEEEELPKQYWRAERFHMEEFLEMQVINAAECVPTSV